MSSTQFRPLMMHTALVAIGLIAGTFGSHLGAHSGTGATVQDSIAGRQEANEGRRVLEAIKVVSGANRASSRQAASAISAVAEHKS